MSKDFLKQKHLLVGVLAFHGDVVEHVLATQKAIKKLKIKGSVKEVRTKADLEGLSGLIIPGGESTTIAKLCDREGMAGEIKKIKNIFGTCAGAILLAKKVLGKATGQQTFGLMDITINRNAYGRQSESFEKNIITKLGPIDAVFIRAPQILSVGKNINILAGDKNHILACEQRIGDRYYLAACFHPELTTTLFHEYFLRQVRKAEIF